MVGSIAIPGAAPSATTGRYHPGISAAVELAGSYTMKLAYDLNKKSR